MGMGLLFRLNRIYYQVERVVAEVAEVAGHEDRVGLKANEHGRFRALIRGR